MYGKQKLISPVQWICLLLSLGLHAILLTRSRGWVSTTPAKIELQAGISAVELTLLPSIASVAKKPAPKPVPAPPPPVIEEPPPAPVVDEPAELSRPEPIEIPEPELKPDPVPEPIPVPEPEPPPIQEAEPETEQPPDSSPEAETRQQESAEQDANLKQKGVESAASSIRPVIPRYPPLSRRRGEEGTVIISLKVTADGRPEDIQIRQSSGYPLLDKAARSAIMRSRFTPATRNGKPVESSLEQPITFELTN